MGPEPIPHPPFEDHALLDSGEGEKLERFGPVVLRRPDPQALWRRRDPDGWRSAHLRFVRESDRGGRWEPGSDPPPEARQEGGWTVRYRDARLLVRPTPFKHVGVFPEQAANWELARGLRPRLGEAPRLLNLFAYTGAASVLALQAGYAVTHVDASRTSLGWAVDNLAASGLGEDAMRLVCDDALAFARREVRRGSRYELVLVDPPHYGRGPGGETWRFEEGIAPLLEAVAGLVAPRACVVVSTYAIGFSPLALANLLAILGAGDVDAGELALPERDGPRLLPAGFCARWRRGLS